MLMNSHDLSQFIACHGHGTSHQIEACQPEQCLWLPKNRIATCEHDAAVLSRLCLTMVAAGLYQGEYKLFIEIHSAYESLNSTKPCTVAYW